MRGWLTTAGSALLAVLLATLLTGCAGDPEPRSGAEDDPGAEPSTSIWTLTPIPVPSTGPPPRQLVADLRQASIDAALGRMQVWIGNGLEHDVTPTAIAYLDARFRQRVAGERLRTIPSGSERGYPLPLPARPTCGPETGAGRVRVTADDGHTLTVPVEDEADVVQRYVASRCLQLEVEKVATVSWASDFAIRGSGESAVAEFVLEVTPTGRSDGELTIDSVGGTPVLTAVDRQVWQPEVTVRADGRMRRIVLPARPARCDPHAFMESGGATAFLVRLHLGDRAGELIVRMTPPVAARAIRFAVDACGLG